MTLHPPRLQWTVGWTAAGALCTIVVLLSSAYRQGRIEQDIVANLLSKSPDGAADVDIQPAWYGRVYQTLGIRRPVTSLFLDGDQLKDDDFEKLDTLRHDACRAALRPLPSMQLAFALRADVRHVSCYQHAPSFRRYQS